MHRAGRRGDVPCPGGLEGLGLGTRSSSARPLSSLCTEPELIKRPHLHPLHSSLLSSRPRALWQALGTEALFWMGGSVWSCASSQTGAWNCSLRCGVEAGQRPGFPGERMEVAVGTFHRIFQLGVWPRARASSSRHRAPPGSRTWGPRSPRGKSSQSLGLGGAWPFSQFSCRHRWCIVIQCGGHWPRGLRFH